MAGEGGNGQAAGTSWASMPTVLVGTELVGEFAGSGYRQPPHLVCRADRQLVRLPALLYSLVRHLLQHQHGDSHHREPAQVLSRVAAAVARDTGIALSPDQILFVIDRKLAPLGITTYSNGTAPAVSKPDPFLALRFKAAVVPAWLTWVLGGMFAWLFRPAIIAVVLAVAAECEIWALATQDFGAAMQNTLRQPASILLVVLLAVASCLIHELGHAAACRYSGIAPGAMGCGVYVAWPAFYTDVTNAYRLGRAGRLRTDLGGVYFNALVAIVLTVCYTQTGFAPLLVALLATNMEIIQQLLPTLRFDGYYIVADLVGIPDLFKYIGPILKRTFLGRKNQRLDDLKPWPQRIVAIWVIVVVPALVAQLALVTIQVPQLVDTLGQSLRDMATMLTTASGNDPLDIAAACVQIVLLLLPVLGVTLIATRAIRALLRLAHRQWQRARPCRTHPS